MPRVRRMNRLLGDFDGRTRRTRHSPISAGTVSNAREDVRRCCDDFSVERQICMEIEQRASAWRAYCGGFVPAYRHGIALIAVAQQRNPSVGCPCKDPLVAFRYLDH